MGRFLLKNAVIVTGASSRKGTLAIDDDRISGIWYEEIPLQANSNAKVIDLKGKILMAGGIDAHVHFREPGLTNAADIASESEAALLGGITSFIDMPNTSPPAVTIEAIEDKLSRAKVSSRINYGFHLGATNDNAGRIIEYLSEGLGSLFGGIKVFMGSSTGNMLVNRDSALRQLFGIKGKPILIHSEDEGIIRANLTAAAELSGDAIPFRSHPEIRSRKACIMSTIKALEMAMELGTSLHVLHVTTKEEVEMIRAAKIHNPNITAETSANYLWLCDEDYSRLGGRMKCNPAIKSAEDKEALRKALAEGVIDTIGSDHAPHPLSEKEKTYLACPSGIPSIQYSLPLALTIARESGIPLTRIAEAYSEKAAKIFGIRDRGVLKIGNFADLTVIDPDKEYSVEGTASKCGWSPYEGTRLRGSIEMVFVNGRPAAMDGKVCEGEERLRPRPLSFE